MWGTYQDVADLHAVFHEFKLTRNRKPSIATTRAQGIPS
jgi:hypothetical protein